MIIESFFERVLTEGFTGLLTKLATSYVTREKRSITADNDTIKRDLTDHLEVTFNKCSKVKTILGDKPSDTLSIYVDQTFSINSNTVDQYTLVERIREGGAWLLIGGGGGGKSMFMRYLWL
jgi:hypothetical protein